MLMSQVGSKNSNPELVVRCFANGFGYCFCLYLRNLAEIPSLFFPRLEKAMFVLTCPKQVAPADFDQLRQNISI